MSLPRLFRSRPVIFSGLFAASVAYSSAGAEAAREPFAPPDLPERPLTPEEEDRAAFNARDVNKDGWLSGREMIGIAHYDLDGNGEVDLAEFLAGRAAERILLRDGAVLPEDIDLFNELDSTGSGYISGLDIERGGIAAFDADGDGRVTRAEFFQGRARLRREMAARAAAERQAEIRRRLQVGEPEPAPPLDEVLQPVPGIMRGRVLTPDGRPVPEFTIEFVGYNIDATNPHLDRSAATEPNLIGRVNGRDGYYQIRLPDSSFGFAASISIPDANGPKQFPLRTEIDRETIDYIEVERRNEGVVKNLIWDPRSSEIKPGALLRSLREAAAGE